MSGLPPNFPFEHIWDAAPRPKIPRVYVAKDKSTCDPPELALSLANGLDVHLIHPSLYQYVIPAAFQVSRRMEKMKNDAAVKTVEKAIVYMQNYLKGISSTFDFTRPPIYMPDPAVIDQNVQLALEEKAPDQVDPELYSDVVNEIQRIKRNALEEGDYSVVCETNQVIKDIHHLDDTTSLQLDFNHKMEKYQNNLRQEQEKYNQSKEYWDEAIKATEDKREAELDALDEEEKKEINSLDESLDVEKGWKPSPKYISMRNKLEFMSMAKRYSEAVTLRDELKALEKQEKARYADRIKLDVHKGKREVQKKYDIRRNGIMSKYEEKLNTQKALRDKELLAKQRYINAVKNKMNDEDNFINDALFFTPVDPKTGATIRSPRNKSLNSSRDSYDSRIYQQSPRTPQPKRTTQLPNLKGNYNDEYESFTSSHYKRRRRIGQIMFTRTPLYMSNPASPRRRGCLYD